MKPLSLLMISFLWLTFFTTAGWAQDRAEAEKLYKEAQLADRNVRTADQAEPKLLQALQIFENLGDKKRVADVNLSLAKRYEVKYNLDPTKVVPIYEKSLSLYKELYEGKGECETLKSLASFSYRSNYQYGAKDYSNVEDYTAKALAACRKVKDREGEAWSFSWLASLNRRAGQYDKAAENYEASIAIDRELGNKEKQIAPLSSLAAMYRDSGKYDKAVQSYERLLSLCKELKSGNLECQADALRGAGMTYAKSGNKDKEQEYLQRFRNITEEMARQRGAR